MPNMLMLRYAGSRGNENRNEMQENQRRNEMRGGNHNEMGGEMRRGNRNEMEGEMEREMRRGNQNAYDRDMEYNRGMERRGENEAAENRYRGRDGRWRSGTRRSEYDGRMEYGNENRRMDDDEERRKYEVEVSPKNVIEWPYGPRDEMPSDDYRSTRQIGFGNRMEHGEREGKERMERGSYGEQPMEFDRELAEHWVRSMKNEDKQHPSGGKWSADMLKPLAQKYGIPTEGKKFWEFYAMTNAMYSDYGEVAKKFGITSPEFYACMAKAWLDDQDAEPDKTALYYEYIVKKE